MDAEENRRPETPGESEMASVVDRNITALLARQKAEEKTKGWQDRVADAITGFTGSMTVLPE